MDELDRLLADQQELIPSPRFAAAVMEAVRRERPAPPPLAFPWRPLLAGSLGAGALGAAALALTLPAAPAATHALAGALPLLAVVAALCLAATLLPRLLLEG
jgi:hypothetical protein